MDIVSVRDLKKRFGGVVAVDGVSFGVRKAETFGLLGPNGAGKTSTIRTLYGFSPITSGEVLVFGLDIRRRWREIRSRLGVCQQENTLDPDLTVLENLLVFASYFDIPAQAARERAEELLTFFALKGRRRFRFEDISGGMARRLMLARSIINRPELLILDEPTTGLDPQSRHLLWERLEELKRGGMTILMTTHYMDEAARLCDRLVIMDHGRILVEGAPEALVAEHAGRQVMEIEDPAPGLIRFLADRGVRYDDLGRRLLAYDETEDGLFDEVCKRFSPSSRALRPATLEDVFLRLTGRELRE
jgi:lipooligosaccharide transport system ATP-binding protein